MNSKSTMVLSLMMALMMLIVPAAAIFTDESSAEGADNGDGLSYVELQSEDDDGFALAGLLSGGLSALDVDRLRGLLRSGDGESQISLSALFSAFKQAFSNYGEKGKTYTIETKVGVDYIEGVLGDNNTYNFVNGGELVVGEGEQLTVEALFTITGTPAKITFEKGSIINIGEEEMELENEVIIVIEGSLSSTVKGDFSAIMNGKVSLIYELDINGKITIQNAIEITGGSDKEVTLNITGEMTMPTTGFLSAGNDGDDENGGFFISMPEKMKANVEGKVSVGPIKIDVNEHSDVTIDKITANLTGTIDSEADVMVDISGDAKVVISAIIKTVGENNEDVTVSYTLGVSGSLKMPKMESGVSSEPDLSNIDEMVPYFDLDLKYTVSFDIHDSKYLLKADDIAVELSAKCSKKDDPTAVIKEISVGIAVSADKIIIKSPVEDNMLLDATVSGVKLSASASGPLHDLIYAGLSNTTAADPSDEDTQSTSSVASIIDLLKMLKADVSFEIGEIDAKIQAEEGQTGVDASVKLNSLKASVTLDQGDPLTALQNASLTVSSFNASFKMYSSSIDTMSIEANNLKVYFETTEGAGVLPAVTADKILIKADKVLDDPASIEMKDIKLMMIDMKSRMVEIKNGTFKVVNGPITGNFKVDDGAKMEFENTEFMGTIMAAETSCLSGTITVPFQKDSVITAGNTVNVAFNETQGAVLKITFGNEPKGLIIPNEGYKLELLHPGTAAVPYTINEDGNGVPDILSGSFYAQLAPETYKVTYGNGVWEKQYGDSVELDVPAAREGMSFVGFYDGLEVLYPMGAEAYLYIVPARDVNITEIWDTTAGADDVTYEDKTGIISVSTENATVMSDALDAIKLKIADQSVDRVVIDTKNAKFDFDSDSIKGFEGGLSLSVNEPDDAAMKKYAKAVGDGKVFTMSVSDAKGSVHNLDGKVKVTVTFEVGDMDTSNLNAYYMDEYGRLEKVDCVITINSGVATATMELEHFSDYVVKSTDQGNGGSNTMFIVIGAVAAVVVIGAVALFIVKKH